MGEAGKATGFAPVSIPCFGTGVTPEARVLPGRCILVMTLNAAESVHGGIGTGHVEDRVISQTDIVQHGDQPPVRPRATAEFAVHLERLRDERGWSKADLAKRAELDPSSITRFEQGARNPDRETVLQLAEAMALPLVERDRLLAAAGYRSEVWDDPLLVEISHLLADREVPHDVRDTVRSVLQMVVAFARLKRFEPL